MALPVKHFWKTKNTVLYHILGWTTYGLVIGLGADKVDADFILKNIAYHLPVMVIFYLCIALLFPIYLDSKSYIKLTALIIVGCSLTVAIRVMLHQLFLQFLPRIPPFDSILFWNQFRANILFAGIAFGYWFFMKNRKNEKAYQKLQSDMAEAQLAHLKNQINPHFLYNTLSFLYAKSLPLSEALSSAIGKLSDMMRYSLEGAEINGLVPLESELGHLKNYIEIHQLRFDNTLQVIFKVNGESASHQIAPLILITFVENTFKHGELNDPAEPARIQVDITARAIEFKADNKIAKGVINTARGIGLENIKSRLRYLYPDRYQLDIVNSGTHHSVYLKLENP